MAGCPVRGVSLMGSTLSFCCFRSWTSAGERPHTVKPKTIYFSSRDELLRVDLSSIVYFEADGNYTRFVSANGLSSMVCMNLGKMEELLALRFKDAPGSFARIGKRFIINLRYVYGINTLKQELVLSDQSTFTMTLELSKVALKALKELISPTPVPDNNPKK